ncbi:hypothetical protein CLAIMM_05686, partial [Cladophialophora immunda]
AIPGFCKGSAPIGHRSLSNAVSVANPEYGYWKVARTEIYRESSLTCLTAPRHENCCIATTSACPGTHQQMPALVLGNNAATHLNDEGQAARKRGKPYNMVGKDMRAPDKNSQGSWTRNSFLTPVCHAWAEVMEQEP